MMLGCEGDHDAVTRVWEALEIKGYTGRAIWEEVAALKVALAASEKARLEAERTSREHHQDDGCMTCLATETERNEAEAKLAAAQESFRLSCKVLADVQVKLIAVQGHLKDCGDCAECFREMGVDLGGDHAT